ncbi:nicotinate-nucleotide-dimethylbenzimidazole phosphoribosyltransferase [Tenacibaculum mesophilum]|uniref:Nicotinate-nucleotide--dimethylbenzimidazole phosphoribosyltransferase n=1 Tax=Tenacibaculum mesophilum TaxID=104268 RepID=A0ABM7CCY0_9FLAO|nr:nicotinate-nucleotide--dimethylbenzimidazole phosphoribosyltransferase [Tenacibaculum mesophilum]AZJ31589.1 nicotinate-nucleotide--dimethylbenzimidazole phosphoribosyltransferase [Tenacibaculum mesophilum]QFS29637.1 nicotinate-nucleotide--dimethylbenzimidazole phosphoribosyltransferase [Tenacibaculum mesophilum]SHG00563.1 nicotinate-nucleotide-dimethylbenzimidazole phosphoribosyltransferase [Tenacibaculum mesophilum]
MTTTITPLSKDLQNELQEEINFKTKPIGALGSLEKIAMQIGLIQNTTTPVLSKPTIMVFAGDHGIATTGKVSPYPQEVTQQMVFNFLQGGAAINVFCKQNNIHLNIIDAGVNADFETHPQLTNAKIAKGTQDYSTTKAMTSKQCQEALEKGRQLVRKVYSEGCNVIGFGEMGISNTSSAALLMSYFTNTPIENCVGRGTGVDDKGLQTKIDILCEVYKLHADSISTPMEALTAFGGFEIVMMCGAMLEAASLKMTLLIDGFIVTAALLAAHAMESDILDYCIFCHNSGEQGHQKMLEFLNAEPLLNLGLRLGEGTGCAVAFPIIQSSVNFLNEMATFKSANVSEA